MAGKSSLPSARFFVTIGGYKESDEMKTGIDASKLVSMLLELVTAVCMVTGITLTAQMGGGFMGGGTAFL